MRAAVSTHPIALSRREVVAWWGVTLVLWLGLWRAGFPAPNVDDLFFSGTAVSLLRGQGLHNPWIESWLLQFGSTDFFAQPPLQPYALRGWLALFGLSTASLLAFQCLAGWIATALTGLLLRRAGCSRIAAAVGCFVVVSFALPKGLRPEIWGVALALVSGWACGQGSRLAWAAGCLAGALAVAFHPFALAIVVPGCALALFRPAPQLDGGALLYRLTAAALAISAVAVLLAWLVDFRIADFWRAFHRHAELRTPPRGTAWATFLHNLTLGHELLLKGPAFALLAGGFIAAWTTGRRTRVRSAAVLFAGLTFLGLLLYAGYTPSWLWPLAVGIGFVLWSSVRAPALHRLGVSATCVAAFWGLVPDWGRILAATREPPADGVALQTAITRRQPARLLVDETAARQVFDFQLPPGARDWLLTRRQDSAMRSFLHAKPPGESWLVDERKLDLYVPDAGATAERFRLFGRQSGDWLLHPHRVRFLP